MMILRPREACKRLGIGKSQFYARFVYREGGETFVAGTKAVPRLKPVPVSERVSGFIDVEVDAVIMAIREERDSGLLTKNKPRDEGGRFIGKDAA